MYADIKDTIFSNKKKREYRDDFGISVSINLYGSIFILSYSLLSEAHGSNNSQHNISSLQNIQMREKTLRIIWHKHIFRIIPGPNRSGVFLCPFEFAL